MCKLKFYLCLFWVLGVVLWTPMVMAQVELMDEVERTAAVTVTDDETMDETSAEEAGTDDETDEETAEEEVKIEPVITAPELVEIGKNVIFGAGRTVNLTPEYPLTFVWDFGDGVQAEGSEVVHTYAQEGDFDITLQVSNTLGDELTLTTQIFVYKKFWVLVTDDVDERERIESLIVYARERGVYVSLIESFDSVSEFITEDALTKKLSESVEDIKAADELVIWTRGSLGLTLMSHFKQAVSEPGLDFSQKEIIFISEGNLSTLVNLARGTFQIVQPKRLLLTRSESLWPFVESANVDELIAKLQERGISFEVVISGAAKIGFTNFLSYLVNFMIDRGIPTNTLKLILMLPVIVTVVAFMKQVIGMTTLGVYTPSIITLSFIALDIKYGLMLLILILLMGTLIRMALRRYRLLYIPRMAIILTLISLTILMVMLLGAAFHIGDLVAISIFPMLIMSTLVEKFVSIQTDKGFSSALLLISETVLVSVLCYYVAEWDYLKTLMLSHPELIFGFLLVNLILGRWSGLRLFEYIRFREVLRHAEEE